MAAFGNVEGLKPEGDNVWSATGASGQALIGAAGGSMGTLRSNAVEASNVDLSGQLVNLIVAQRNYQPMRRPSRRRTRSCRPWSTCDRHAELSRRHGPHDLHRPVGRKQILDQQAAVSNNLANVSTPAFRAQVNLYRACRW